MSLANTRPKQEEQHVLFAADVHLSQAIPGIGTHHRGQAAKTFPRLGNVGVSVEMGWGFASIKSSRLVNHHLYLQ